MSEVSKHVDWCLKKAEKEIGESLKIGKRAKHRGLVKINQDINEAQKHLEKAEHYLKVTEYLVRGDFSDISLGTLFYTMYQCFLSIASNFGYESRNQLCTISLIKYLNEQGKINMDERFLRYFEYGQDNNDDESIIDLREDYTYGTRIEADREKIDFFVNECKELIYLTKEIIFR